jgi:hypothetical protein
MGSNHKRSISTTTESQRAIDAGLTPDTTYYYRVVAINANGELPPSNARAVPLAPRPWLHRRTSRRAWLTPGRSTWRGMVGQQE